MKSGEMSAIATSNCVDRVTPAATSALKGAAVGATTGWILDGSRGVGQGPATNWSGLLHPGWNQLMGKEGDPFSERCHRLNRL